MWGMLIVSKRDRRICLELLSRQDVDSPITAND